MTDPTRIAHLIVRRLDGEITSEETAELNEWIGAAPENKVFMETRMTPEAIAKKQKILWEMDRESLDRRLARVLHNARKRKK